MSKKNTKRALLSSVLALVLCLAMLTGTTFAWFTDSVTSGKNQIIAGNLDVELVHTNSYIADEKVDGLTDLFTVEEGKTVLWEPGVVVWENLTVKNVGNLALKYQLAINFDNENTILDAEGNNTGYKLSDILKIAVVDPIAAGTSREDVLAAAKATGVSLTSFVLPETLTAGDSDTYGLVIYWEPGENDNNWNVQNGKSTSNGKPLHIDLGVTLYASQMVHEDDSFDNKYDEDADAFRITYTFDTAADLAAFDPAGFNSANLAGSGLSIANGKAVVDNKGAFFYNNVNLGLYTYGIEYDVDVAAMDDGDVINLETGDTATWSGSNYVTIEKGFVSVGPAANNPTGYIDRVAVGEQLHVTHTYAVNEAGKWVTTTVITDGTNTYSASKTVDSAPTGQIYWDVYDLGASASGKVTLDNFTFYAQNAEVSSLVALEAALNGAQSGDTITLGNMDFGTVTLSGELDGVTIAAQENTAVKFYVESGAVLNDVTFQGLDAEYSVDSGAYLDGGIINIKSGAKVKNLTIEDCEFNGAGGRSAAITVAENTAEITLKDCVIDGPKYVVYGSAAIAKLTLQDCEIKNISSWAVMLNGSDVVGAQLTIDNCIFENCPDGIAKYLGGSQPEGSFTVFTNNTLTNCKGHDGSDAKWFTIPGASSTITVSGNTLDGADWIPGTAQGLGK